MATKYEIFNYVMKTPENTNPAILKSLLETISDNSGSNIDTGIHHTLKLISINEDLMTPPAASAPRFIQKQNREEMYQILHIYW